MNQDSVFQILAKKSVEQLLELLELAWQQMNTAQKEEVFGGAICEAQHAFPASVEETQEAVKEFHKDSLAGNYYAPFEINSKNFMDIPEETNIWFAKLGELFIECSKLTDQQEYNTAVECFTLLYELTDAVDSGDEIIFGDEIGMWMFGDQKPYFAAYFKALAAISTPDDFSELVMPLISDDGRHGLVNEIYASVQNAATEEQMVLVDQLVKDKGIRISKKE